MRNVLLAVSGLSPQVITETLFALHELGKRVDEIHVITTRKGRDMIASSLLDPEDGHFYRYLREYGIDPTSISFDFSHVHVISDANGAQVDDIADENDNELLLRLCLDLTFHLTRDQDTAVFFSIAGGRKTMSACLMTAAQMYGRAQDRVYHVLVSPEFESNRDFFYPPRKSTPIELKDERGQPYIKETRYARISLVPVPFVSIRDRLAGELLKQPSDPATLMMSLVRENHPGLSIDLPNCKVSYMGREVDMPRAQIALYAFFALLKRNCARKTDTCRGCDECYLDVTAVVESQKEITRLYASACEVQWEDQISRTAGITSLGAEEVRQYRSKINRTITAGFGITAGRLIMIESTGKRPDTRYGIPLDRNRIRVVS